MRRGDEWLCGGRAGGCGFLVFCFLVLFLSWNKSELLMVNAN